MLVKGNFSTTAVKRLEGRRILAIGKVGGVWLWEPKDAVGRGQWQQELFFSVFPGGNTSSLLGNKSRFRVSTQSRKHPHRPSGAFLWVSWNHVVAPWEHTGYKGLCCPRHKGVPGRGASLDGVVSPLCITATLPTSRYDQGQTILEQLGWYLTPEIIIVVPENPMKAMAKCNVSIWSYAVQHGGHWPHVANWSN